VFEEMLFPNRNSYPTVYKPMNTLWKSSTSTTSTKECNSRTWNN